MTKKKEDPTWDPVMGAEFHPLRALWEGANPPYPSEQSARWAIRQLQRRLADVGALGLHRGMLFIHMPKLVQVAREHAIEQATKRCVKKDRL
ncbi:hypothetical protein [Ramlibacter rhizophilus]|uniref:Uncharacterized protein n=1 Tax=Ramlibacter rhizophilus TaxID=1781167 RepID=A0A4Z0BVN0_9BURK|nr:hypothetical protein [Ramlibacter rhizophilus]TFZ03366.1 hypothetical protein EZ242_05645 [Ramlibacter rhizophilus]